MISRISGFLAAVAMAATLALSSQASFAQAADAASAAPTTTEAAPAAAAAPKSEENPYGLGHMLSHGDAVSKGVLFLLAIMSMGSWYILITKLWDTQKLANEAKEVRATFFKKASLADGVKGLKDTGAFRFIAASAIEASEHHEGALTENIDHSSWVTMNVERAVGEVNSRVGSGLGFLATVGSTSPFIGLFGTVWGILQALTAIGVAGQASIDKVAGPVGEALIMTAIGLGVAVPAVLGYNWLVNRNKAVMAQVRAFAADLHGVLMGNRAKR
ncbi:MotA/TolQ/ExbB proton channel family protein [Pelomonas sp. SE-A7]|uniref:MotA/TolQ/ExbB proton channel family protein n=1 Tax=Pelomonas sp. SE-A7 TaxID=3054953 RepID=UPI00259CC56D|nr:MotA/TolQ/ExbB proton channel family protein [Pelomonas sp. SE-A7]MDM4765750.1 MotA/TolQ/ExbB proton channel family protein [Pelomonas sp. SE-A7]